MKVNLQILQDLFLVILFSTDSFSSMFLEVSSSWLNMFSIVSWPTFDLLSSEIVLGYLKEFSHEFWEEFSTRFRLFIFRIGYRNIEYNTCKRELKRRKSKFKLRKRCLSKVIGSLSSAIELSLSGVKYKQR